ncbi:MAG: PEP/pyruvate-binding domain-containing protein, partial [Nocardioidaceae bacterium]
MRTRTALLTELHELDGDDATRSGRKAATLGRLARAGIAVPEGLVLSTEALDRMLADTPAGCATTEHLLTAELPPDVRVAVGEIAEHFGDAVLAVRSSAVAEDLPQASYAGQYETVLNVRGADALHRAVRRCWASVDSDRLRAYGHGAAAEAPALAVLVQRQVDADVAGVAFTRDPVSGATDRVLVSAAPGLGDAVVGGTVDPDEWVVTGQSAVAAR